VNLDTPTATSVTRPRTTLDMQVANPDVLGLWAFALGTFLGNLTDTGQVSGGGLATGVAIFLGGLAQLLAGLQEYHTRTILDEWAYANPYRTEQERRDAFPAWLHGYNHHRRHTALHGQPPASRVPNLTGQST
jgi:transposase InsO family protein